MMVKAYALLVQKKEHEKMERLLNMTKGQYIENCNMEKYYAKFGSDAFALRKEQMLLAVKIFSIWDS